MNTKPFLKSYEGIMIAGVAAACLTLVSTAMSFGQSPDARISDVQIPDVQIPDDATDEFLLKQAQRALPGITSKTTDDFTEQNVLPFMAQVIRSQRALAYADALLDRFPDSRYRDQALMVKLAALGRLSWTQLDYLAELRTLTEHISQSKPKEEIAAENDYYAIQAFVLGARYEKMPEQRRLLGSLERYKAFVKDHPKSPRRPILWASLIRSAIALNQHEVALREYAQMKHAYPDHPATQRATGEISGLSAMGKPFAFVYSTEEGQKIDTRDFRGKVLLVHFWATWDEAAIEQLESLRILHKEHAGQGLQLIGINVDTDHRALEETLAALGLPWPQYYDFKGFKNDILIGLGVVKIPVYYLVDRKGILRAVTPSPELLTSRLKPMLEASD